MSIRDNDDGKDKNHKYQFTDEYADQIDKLRGNRSK